MSETFDRLSDVRLADELNDIVARFEGLWCAVNGAISLSDVEQRGILQIVADAKDLAEALTDRFEQERELRMREAKAND